MALTGSAVPTCTNASTSSPAARKIGSKPPIASSARNEIAPSAVLATRDADQRRADESHGGEYPRPAVRAGRHRCPVETVGDPPEPVGLVGRQLHLAVVIVATYLTFFPVTINTIRGLHSADRRALELMQSYAAGEWRILWKLRVPAALPYIFAALKVSATASVVGATIATGGIA